MKKDEFLPKENKIFESIPRLSILVQIFAQRPTLYKLNTDTVSVRMQHQKTTKELIKNGN